MTDTPEKHPNTFVAILNLGIKVTQFYLEMSVAVRGRKG